MVITAQLGNGWRRVVRRYPLAKAHRRAGVLYAIVSVPECVIQTPRSSSFLIVNVALALIGLPTRRTVHLAKFGRVIVIL